MPVLLLSKTLGHRLRHGARSVRAWQVWSVPPPLRAYVLSITGFGAVVATMAAVRTHWQPSYLVIYVGLLACGVIAIESTRTVREVGSVARDLQTVWYLAIAVLLPPACALLAPVPLTAYRLWRVRRGFVYRRVFSNATISLAYGSVSFFFHSLPKSVAGPAPGTASHALTWTGVVAACGAGAWLINNGLILGAIKIADPKARIRNLFGNREAATSDLIELSLAVSLSLVVAINSFLMLLALPSIVLYRRYVMHAQIVAQARLDGKTGLLNASTWQREAEVELLRAVRARTPLAIAMVNIDHFQDVNEMAGQLVRDQLVRDIAGILKEQVPYHDLVGRFGSDEFAILLPQTSRNEAQRISERIRDYIAAEPIAIDSGSHEGFVFRLTVSIGVAVLNESRRALAELIGAADSALVTAKSTGWSKVYVLPDGADEPDLPDGSLTTP